MIVLVLTWVAFGLLVGLMARAILPARQPINLLATTLVGIIGALVGGLLGNVFVGVRALELHPAGFIGSVMGALFVLLALGMRHRHAAA